MVGFLLASWRIDRIATCRIKSQARKLHASTAIVNSLNFALIYIYLLIIRLSSSWLEIHTMRYFYQLGFNIEYQNWPWIEGHRNVSLSIISEYWSIFGLEIFDGFVKIKFRYLEKDEWNFDHVRFKNCEMWILRIENN